MRILLIGVLAMGLASCGDDSPKIEADPFGDEAASGEEMQAGLWSQTVSLEDFDVPGAPPGSETLLQEAFGSAASNEACMTEEELSKGVDQRAKEAMQGQSCEAEGFENELGKIAGAMTCTSGGSTTLVKINGRYDAESMDMILAMTMADPSGSGNGGSMSLKVAAKRIGDCAG